MKRLERQWMYKRLDERKKPKLEFAKGVQEFLEFASQSSSFKNYGEMRCPCSKCKNRSWRKKIDVENHLWSNGFVNNYYVWTYHGEEMPTEGSTSTVVSENPSNLVSWFDLLFLKRFIINIQMITEYNQHICLYVIFRIRSSHLTSCFKRLRKPRKVSGLILGLRKSMTLTTKRRINNRPPERHQTST